MDLSSIKNSVVLIADNRVKLTRVNGEWYVQDLDSESGTFVNDKEVYGKVRLKNGDYLKNGDFITQITISHSPVVSNSNIPVLSINKGVQTVHGKNGNRNILNDVSVCAYKGEFIGVLGSSGSGKSTLLKAIAGINHLTEGQILRNGFLTTSEQLLNDQRIAYLPQDVVIHEELTPNKALKYISELKQIPESQIEIQRVLERVGMLEYSETPIQRLSGGQRKRVALAAELLGNPEILLLDEATSGLDPATEREMMELFRSLAEEGKTVLCVTHFAGRLFNCNRLLYLMQGNLIFNGSPQEYQRFFEIQDLEDAYTKQKSKTIEEWKEKYQREFGNVKMFKPLDQENTLESAPKSSCLEQITILFTRYCSIQFSDWKSLLLLILQAPVIALMVGLAFGDIRADFAELHASRVKEVVFTLILATLWCSGTSSIREIVKEKAILTHEIRFGLNATSYLLSKFFFLTILSMLQTILLLSIVKYTTCLTGNTITQLLILIATGITGVSIGLLLSSISSNSERAMTFLPVVLIAQAIFSGGLATLTGIIRIVAQLIVPAYWALEGMRSTFPVELTIAQYPGAPGEYQYPILGLGVSYIITIVALSLMLIFLLLLALLAIRMAYYKRSLKNIWL
ncbi:MAG: ATP-binding cassette domain-containing protein [Alphaproteobacteria bacterium]|nr:ATP-binding cassette domain-containing protein [Alphaproteobacteria bacterium]